MHIERVFNENANLDNILEGIIDTHLERNFNDFLNNLLGQSIGVKHSNTDHTIDEKIDCVTQNTDKGGTQS